MNEHAILTAIGDAEERLRRDLHRRTQELKELFKRELGLVLAELGRIKSPVRITIIVSGQSIHIPGLKQGEDMSYTVPRDHQDEPFTLDPISCTDSEGDVAFTETLASDNESVVSIVGTSFHFGTFGGANITRKVAVANQGEFIVATAVFNVTPGGVTVSGGGITVPGLTPDPAP